MAQELQKNICTAYLNAFTALIWQEAVRQEGVAWVYPSANILLKLMAKAFMFAVKLMWAVLLDLHCKTGRNKQLLFKK